MKRNRETQRLEKRQKKEARRTALLAEKNELPPETDPSEWVPGPQPRVED